MANVISKDILKAEGWGREVLAKRVAIVGVITIVLNLVVGYGWLGVDFSDQVLRWVGAFFDALTAVLAIVAARPVVTPVASPKNNKGEVLVPTSTVSKAIEEALQKQSADNAKAAEAEVVPSAPAAVVPPTTPSA